MAHPSSRRDAQPSINPGFHVVIIGAGWQADHDLDSKGATGLLVAQGLQKHGIRYSLFERDAASDYNLRPRDWSMGLHWGRRFLAQLLPDHLAREAWQIEADPWSLGGRSDTALFPAADPPPRAEGYEFELKGKQETNFDIVDLTTGDILSSVGAETSRRTSRRKLREFLRRGVDIQHGKKLVTITEGPGELATAHFDDGTSASGDIILGADSGRSRVRSFILPPEHNQLHYFPIRLFNFNARFTHEQALYIRRHATHPLFWYGIHDPTHTVFTASILDTPDPNDGSTWTFQLGLDTWDTEPSSPFAAQAPPPAPTSTPDPSVLTQHAPDPPGRLADFRALAAPLAEPFRSSAAWVPDGTYISPDRISHLPTLHAWTGPGARGRVALAGDAAHPMSPYRGQGLNNAVADAAAFVDAAAAVASGADRRAVLTAYGEEVRARGQREIDVSGRQAFDVHHLAAFRTSEVARRGFHQ